MRKYEEEHYRLDKIKDNIYPWVKGELIDYKVINGKEISEKDTPLIAFAGDLHIVLVINRGNDTYEIIRDKMLPADCDIEELYRIACANLVRDVKFVVSQTLYDGFGIVADGYHEASSLCFQHIWTMCADKLKDDLLIIAPARDTVLFLPLKEKEKLPYMKEYAKQAYERNLDKISLQMFRFSRKGKELTTYEED